MGEGDKGAGMETLVVVDTEEASLLFDGRPPKIAHHSNGLSIPDALIAAIVLESKALLITGNLRHFQFIPGLEAETPPYRRG